HVPNIVTGIYTIGQRVIVSDVQESLFWVRYRRNENQLIIFADDTYPRWVTTACLLDYDTMASADKFGNISIVRLPPNTSDEVDEDPTGNKALWDRGLLNGASQKAEVIMNYHIGETVLSLQKTTLIPGGSESLVYTTLSGGIGILVPFTSHEDHDFFQHLEMHMRSEFPPLCGRDHLSFRSYYFPVKVCVFTGDPSYDPDFILISSPPRFLKVSQKAGRTTTACRCNGKKVHPFKFWVVLLGVFTVCFISQTFPFCLRLCLK
ncbi:Splicing factor 3B subunit 3, partial [Ataeniobius toweri]|nr:Splicing factor 3B subunit 3 [Ataeniobius toweri]